MSAIGPGPARLDAYLAVRTAHGAALTADGRHAVVLSDLAGVHQAWAVDVAGSWPRLISPAAERVQSVHASPSDGDVVVLGLDVGGNERTQLHRVDLRDDELAPLATNPEVIHRPGAFSADGTTLLYTANDRNGIDFDLYRVDLASGEITTMARLDGSTWVSDVLPDGSMAVLARARSLMDVDLAVVDLADGRVRALSDDDRRTLPGGVDSAGRMFACSDRDGEHLRAGWFERDGAWRGFGPTGADVDGLAVRGDLGALVVNEEGTSRLWLFDALDPQRLTEVRLPLGVVEDLRWDPTGSRLSLTLSGPQHPGAVWIVDPTAGAAPVTVPSTPGLRPADFCVPTLEHVESFDGLEVPVWMYRPDDVARPPTVVWVHGGPEAQSRPAFNVVFAALVDAGFAVVAPNVRGSTGYGRTYASLDDRRRRPDAVADLVEVGRWLAARDDVDGDRIAVAGGSYGGFMTLAALVAAPELWAAGVDIVGIANLVTFLENTGAYRRALREPEYGNLTDDSEFLRQLSPLTHVERITAPLLVIHGQNDPRVPVGEAHQIADRLDALDRDVELLVFDDEGHGISRLANRRTAYGRMLAFLAEHL